MHSPRVVPGIYTHGNIRSNLDNSKKCSFSDSWYGYHVWSDEFIIG